MSDTEDKGSHENFSDNDADDGPDKQSQASVDGCLQNSQVFDQSVTSGLDDTADNFSIEVHLGCDSSRHASEISSLSYQNLLEEGDSTSASIMSRRGSDDSNDSYPPDFENELPPDDIETFEASDLPLSEHYTSWRKKHLSKGNCEEGKQADSSSSKVTVPSVVGSDKKKERSRDGKHDSGGITPLASEAALCKKGLQNLSVSDTAANQDSGVLRRKKSNVSNTVGKGLDDVNGVGVKKRNSLEIRNNIPVVGEVKDCENSVSSVPGQPLSVKPQLKNLKQSPGLARRICDNPGEPNSDVPISGNISSLSEDKLAQEDEIADDTGNLEVITPLRRNIDIENEYDYVKYARVQHGNSYVGMRLAYSSSNDSLSLQRNSVHSHGSGSIDSSREPSPEKSLHQKILADQNGHVAQQRVSEDSLTEIPLNTDSCQNEGRRPFTLSPEATECDSVEVESVTSDGENSTPGFPTVEDGLSSSQGSDVEDGPGFDPSSPTHRLRMKQKAEIEQEISKSTEDEHGVS